MLTNQQHPSALVIDDDDAIRGAIISVLRDEGWDAYEASNGREGLERLRTEPQPTVILLDVMMPEMNGAELLDILRQDKTLAQIPVIQTSAGSKSALPGISARLDKPFTVEKMMQVLSTYSRLGQEPARAVGT